MRAHSSRILVYSAKTAVDHAPHAEHLGRREVDHPPVYVVRVWMRADLNYRLLFDYFEYPMSILGTFVKSTIILSLDRGLVDLFLFCHLQVRLSAYLSQSLSDHINVLLGHLPVGRIYLDDKIFIVRCYVKQHMSYVVNLSHGHVKFKF